MYSSLEKDIQIEKKIKDHLYLVNVNIFLFKYY